MLVKGDMMVSSQEGTTDFVVRNSHDTGWLVGILAAPYKAFKPKVEPPYINPNDLESFCSLLTNPGKKNRKPVQMVQNLPISQRGVFFDLFTTPFIHHQ